MHGPLYRVIMPSLEHRSDAVFHQSHEMKCIWYLAESEMIPRQTCDPIKKCTTDQ